MPFRPYLHCHLIYAHFLSLVFLTSFFALPKKNSKFVFVDAFWNSFVGNLDDFVQFRKTHLVFSVKMTFFLVLNVKEFSFVISDNKISGAFLDLLEL